MGPTIEELPDFVIRQIRAGEVIERPSQLLKEVIENSLDAQSTLIEISLKGPGPDWIQVRDNGVGMSFEDLCRAFKRHTTSKIHAFDDLYQLQSYGFRGEALAAIAASCRVHCRTQGGEITINFGKPISQIQAPGPQDPGTTLTISDLFLQTPVRLKFLKAKGPQRAAIHKVLNAFFLSWPQVSFSLKWDDAPKKIFPAAPLPQRAQDVLGLGEKNLVELNEQKGPYSIKMLIGKAPKKGRALKQFLFVNRRLFFDRKIHAVLSQQMAPLWGASSGDYVIFIEAPPQDIDVNVHPQKTQVEFLERPLIYSLLAQKVSVLLGQPLEQDEHPSPFEQNLSQPQDSRTIFVIDEDFFVFKKEHQTARLVSTKKLWATYLSMISQKKTNETIPLVVARPLPLSPEQKKSLQQLKALWPFESEPLEEGLEALLSIPAFLRKLPYQEIFSVLLGQKANWPPPSIPTYLEEAISQLGDLSEISRPIDAELFYAQPT